MSKAIVRILSGGFVVYPSAEMFSTFTGFLYRMYRYEFRKVPVRKDGRVTMLAQNELKEKWVFEHRRTNEYRLHITYLEEFRRHFANYDIDYIVDKWEAGDDVEIEMQDFYSPRDSQGDWIKFLTTEDGPHLSLPATMGGGKTVTFLACASVLGKRAAAIIPPFLSDRWMLEIGKFTKLKKNEYIYISGLKLLKSYMATLEAGRNPFKIVLFSINTIRNYIRDYYDFPEGWIYSPEEFFKRAKFGVKGVDEAHKDLHFHFISNLFFNTSRYINLSGTLDKEDQFLNEMAKRNYPVAGRCPVDDVVASTRCSIYKLYFSGWIPKHRSPMGYSHVIYENYIRYHPSVCRAYFTYIAKILYAEYSGIRSQKTDKALVFFATIKLADMFLEFITLDKEISKHFQHLKIGRLRAGEPDEACHPFDVTITTVGRAGTGFDLPNILTVLNTIAINDGPLQRQVLGRGRKRDDVDCRYVRLYSPHIPKHVDYHLKSLSVLGDLASAVKVNEQPGSLPFPTGYDFQHAAELEKRERDEKKKQKAESAKKRKKKKKKSK